MLALYIMNIVCSLRNRFVPLVWATLDKIISIFHTWFLNCRQITSQMSFINNNTQCSVRTSSVTRLHRNKFMMGNTGIMGTTINTDNVSHDGLKLSNISLLLVLHILDILQVNMRPIVTEGQTLQRNIKLHDEQSRASCSPRAGSYSLTVLSFVAHINAKTQYKWRENLPETRPGPGQRASFVSLKTS